MTHGEALQILGIRLVGATPENGRKLLLSLILLLAMLAIRLPKKSRAVEILASMMASRTR